MDSVDTDLEQENQNKSASKKTISSAKLTPAIEERLKIIANIIIDRIIEDQQGGKLYLKGNSNKQHGKQI